MTLGCGGQGEVFIQIGVCVTDDVSQTPHGQVRDQRRPAFLLPSLPAGPNSAEIPGDLTRSAKTARGSSCWTELPSCPGLSGSCPSSPSPAVWAALSSARPGAQSPACGLRGALFALLGKRRKKILDLKDRLDIQTLDLENWLQEQSQEVPFEQRRSPAKVDAGRRGRSSIKHM